jgi:hypothetical protein
MRHIQPRSFLDRAQASYYVFTSFVGGLIRNTSLLLIILCFCFAVAAAGFNIAKSLWHVPGVRSFVAALKADLADTDPSAVDTDTPPPPHLKDLAKVDRDENRARRKLAAELRRSKASTSSTKAARQPGSGI